MTDLALVDSGAEFSIDRAYRYKLWRRWAAGPMLMVIGLNPSTADETQDDPTLRRCIGYAKRWGFGGLVMANLFAYRATDPRDLRSHVMDCYKAEPAKRAYLQALLENYRAITAVADDTIQHFGAVLAAWGIHGSFDRQARHMRGLLRSARGGLGYDVACLGVTKTGEPKHPLYLRADAVPEPFLGDGGSLCRERVTNAED